MKKKQRDVLLWEKSKIRKLFRIMKLTSFICLCFVCSVSANVMSQKLTMHLGETSIQRVFDEIREQTQRIVLYNDDRLSSAQKVIADFQDVELETILKKILANSGMDFQLVDDYILIVRDKGDKFTLPQQVREITGKVTDRKGVFLPGVSVTIKGTQLGVSTDADGNFRISLPEIESLVLVFSFVGMKTQEIRYTGQKTLTVVLEETVTEMDEVVVTGIFERKKESFTGSATTYKAEQLRMIGNQNVIQGLRTLDPAFAVMENNNFGSDPNRLPEIEIRGTSSFVGLKDEFGINPNQPLFILDGFETDLKTVIGLDMSRVESLTLLKDAVSTAIYGARAANGVVVIETKRPQRGKLQVSYLGDFSLEIPDLSGYNLMNAAEKLEFERLSGAYEGATLESSKIFEQFYNERLAEVARGVDTYWLGEPLRTAFSNAHSLTISGGDDVILYSLGISFKNTQGVMKESYNKNLNAHFDLSYRYKNLLFRNNLTLYHEKGNDSPYESFKNFAEANPYFRKYNEEGVAEKYLTTPGLGMGQTIYGEPENIPNPLYNASLNNRSVKNTFQVRNNFNIEYTIVSGLKLRGRFGVERSDLKEDSFNPAKHTKFDTESDPSKRGHYEARFTEGMTYDGDVTLTFGQLFRERHMVNAVVGWSINSKKSDMEGYEAIGFPSSVMDHPLFSRGYPDNGKPLGSDAHSRAVGFYGQFGYVYDNRYLCDLSYRSDGASQFGANKRFVDAWSVGLAWNLHNEKFMQHADFADMIKIRASVGTPGYQNFSSYQTLSVYNYDASSSMRDRFDYLGAYLEKKGNPDLKWQQTLDQNFGLDLGFFNNRLMLSADARNRLTKELIAFIGTPSSTGYEGYLANVGNIRSVGFTLNASGILIKRPADGFRWHMNLTMRHNKDTYRNIGDHLDYLNKENVSKSLTRYVNGKSVTSLWAVKSLGIDPSTGQELFLKKDGQITVEHDFDDEVIVGDSREKLNGIVGTSLYYKGWSLNVNFRYSLGADKFNTALFDKVENISAANVKKNQDKRALYDRWKNPGDRAKFKAIGMTGKTEMSSRFVQKENYLSGESIRLGYEAFDAKWMQAVGFTRFAVSLYLNDIFRWSNIRIERGIDYPFARLTSLSVSVSF